MTSNNACEPGEQLIVLANGDDENDLVGWSLLLLAATVRSFAHVPLGISDRNKMVLWPGCGGRAEFSLHTKNVRSVWFVVKRRGFCCNLSGGVALIVWLTTNRMCAKNKNICMWREQAIIEWSRQVISIVACCHGVKLCVHAARDFRSQQNGAVTRMWRSCGVQPSHTERDEREEQKYMYVAQTRVIPMEWSWWVASNNACEPGEQLIVLANGDDESDLVVWSLLLLAATVRSFAHVPLGISDRNNSNGNKIPFIYSNS